MFLSGRQEISFSTLTRLFLTWCVRWAHVSSSTPMSVSVLSRTFPVIYMTSISIILPELLQETVNRHTFNVSFKTMTWISSYRYCELFNTQIRFVFCVHTKTPWRKSVFQSETDIFVLSGTPLFLHTAFSSVSCLLPAKGFILHSRSLSFNISV